MADYPHLGRYMLAKEPLQRSSRFRAVERVSLGAMAVVAIVLLLLRSLGFVSVFGLWIVAIGSFGLYNRFSPRLHNWTASRRNRALIKRAVANSPEELKEMERGALAWFRIQAAVEGRSWSAVDQPETRRFAASEVIDSAGKAMNRLVHQPMSCEDRAWLAFGLERLAEEVEAPPSTSGDHVGLAIQNRRAVRMANELNRSILGSLEP